MSGENDVLRWSWNGIVTVDRERIAQVWKDACQHWRQAGHKMRPKTTGLKTACDHIFKGSVKPERKTQIDDWLTGVGREALKATYKKVLGRREEGDPAMFIRRIFEQDDVRKSLPAKQAHLICIVCTCDLHEIVPASDDLDVASPKERQQVDACLSEGTQPLLGVTLDQGGALPIVSKGQPGWPAPPQSPFATSPEPESPKAPKIRFPFPDRLADLKALLCQLDQPICERAFEELSERINLPRPDPFALDTAVHTLDQEGFCVSRPIKSPLLAFVGLVKREIADARLEDWINDVQPAYCQAYGLPAGYVLEATPRTEATAPEAPRTSRPYLAVALWVYPSRSERYVIESWLVNQTGQGEELTVPQPSGALEPSQLSNAFAEIFRHRSIATWDAGDADDEEHLHIELFLHEHDLCRDLDDWPLACDLDQGDVPIPATNPIVVRPYQRFSGPWSASGGSDQRRFGREAASRNWRHCSDDRRRRHEDENLSGLADVRERATDCDALLEDDACILLLHFVPTAGDMVRILGSGATGVVWCGDGDKGDLRHSLVEKMLQVRRRENRTPTLGDLPKHIHALRRSCYRGLCTKRDSQPGDRDRAAPHTGRYHLLWDNPGRIPPFRGFESTDTPPQQRTTKRLKPPRAF